MTTEFILILIYLTVGCLSTFWVEKLMVGEGFGNELGIAFGMGDRIRSIVLWPVFTGEYILDFIILFIKNILLFGEDDQQQT